MATAIIGARRSGKSFRALQAAQELIDRQILESADQVCHLDFDNPILAEMSASDLHLIQQIFLKTYPAFTQKTPICFIFDEMHKILGWEAYVTDLSRNPNWKVIVTGSSSKMLKHDIATELRGKSVAAIVYPLNFKEFLRFKGFSQQSHSTKGQAEIRRLFDEYLKWGSYPALAVMADDYPKEEILREYFDTMLLKDIIQRHQISRPQQCIHLYRYLLANIGRSQTLQSFYRNLKQAGFSASRDMVRDYVSWAVDSWLFYLVPLYSNSMKEQERNYKKVYAIDWALANKNSSTWDGSLSRAFENMVFIHLHQSFHRVHYYLTKTKRQEVDFIAVGGNGEPLAAIQVCMDISSEETLKRESEALGVTARYFNIKDNFILTYNQEKDLEAGGVRIKAIPARKWLLENLPN
jgi:hypothetical protein